MVRLKTLYDEANKKYPIKAKKINTKRSTKTGFKGVVIVYCGSCKQKFMFQYRYKNDEGKRKILSSTNLSRLKDKMDLLGFSLEINNEELARETIAKFGGV